MAGIIARQVISGLSRPILVTAPSGDQSRLFILEQHSGKILIFNLSTGTLEPQPFLKIESLSQGNEQGLLGMAFAPDFATSGLFYVNFTSAAGTTNIRRFKVDDAEPNRADPNSGITVMVVPQPFANHNGGCLAFSPHDGMLYIGLGDGGSGNDPGNRAQNLSELLGKMLRIDVSRNDFPGDATRSYGIPPDNPFVNRPNARKEIWALGLRNPWRFSFDRQTNDLYIGDVGQGEREEVDFQPSNSTGGENYGWRMKEGTRVTGLDVIPQGALLRDPIVEYSHDTGEQAIIGGYVYRGVQLPDLSGTYFFADATGTVTSFKTGTAPQLTPRTDELFPDGIEDIASFGEDGAGELYICSLSGEVFRISSNP